LVKAPLGRYLPAGFKVRVDDGQAETLGVQTCDAAGCYAGTAVADALLARMASGRQLSVGFQDLSRRDVSVSLPLDGFAEGLKRIQ
jgi:invasion protein IalB